MFRTLKSLVSRSIQNPAIPLTHSNILNYLGGAKSHAGVTVNKSTALTLGPVWQAVTMISGDVAKLPLDVFKRTGESSREKDKRHRAYYALRWQANERQTAYKMWRRAMVHLLIWNRSFVWVNRDGSKIKLYNLLPDRTWWNPNTGLYETEYGNGKLRGLDPSEVLELEGIHTGVVNECELVTKAREEWGAALANQQFKSRFFSQGTKAGGFLEIPAHFTKEAAENLEVGFKSKNEGSSNWFGTVILRDGAKFHKVTTSPKDSQLDELSEADVRNVARWYNLAPSRLGVKESSSYGEKSEDNEAYFDQTLSHHCMTIKTECWSKCLTEDQKLNDTHIIEHNVRALVASSPKAQADIGKIEMEMGVITPNDYLAATNRNPIEGGGIKLVPKTHYMILDGEILNPDGDSPSELPSRQVSPETARAVFSTAFTLAVGKVVRTLKREAGRKSATRFCSWWDSSDLMAQVQRDLAPAAEVLGCAIDLESPEDHVGRFVGQLEKRVNDLLSMAKEETLAQSINDLCFEFSQIEPDQLNFLNGESDDQDLETE